MNLHVITTLWEGSNAFCYSVSGFADLTTWNKPDRSSDFIGQEQYVKVNSGDKGVWQGRETTHGMMFNGGLQAELKEDLPESLLYRGAE